MSDQSPATAPPTVFPTARQLEYADWETGLMMHFGIRTFCEGHVDWDGKPMDPAAFNPTQLDCGQWIAAAKSAGMKYAIMTTKHHDGFAVWPTKMKDYSVAASPWAGGQGDVVRQYVAACREHGLAVGLYYSPAEWGNPVYDDPPAYDEYMLGQFRELLADYGPIDILWLDGCGSEGHPFDWPRLVSEIRSLQPDILMFNMGDPDYRWGGNECGLATEPCDNVACDGDNAPGKWLPTECNARLRFNHWFYSDTDAGTIKTVGELMGIYNYSVGRGANLIINVAPDRRGLVPEPDVQRLAQFGDEIRRRFANPLATLDDGELTEDGWQITFDEPTMIDQVVLAEDLSQGQRVRRFELKIRSTHQGEPRITIYDSTRIGHKAICRFPLVAVRELSLHVAESDGPVKLRSATVHCIET